MKGISALIKENTKEFPRAEIEYILSTLLNKKRYELYLNEIKVNGTIEQKFNWVLQQRKKGVPIQYLLRTANFLNFELYVDERVFIPRPETEELVIKTINRLASPNLILELGTGSGAIAIALANAFPKVNILATDVDQAALSVAKINIEKYNLADRISLIHANLFDLPFPTSLSGQVDCLISNPPYIDSATIPLLDRTVKDYEPRLSLDGGKKGFEIIQIIINQGQRFLKPSGIIALEIDPTHKDLILRQVPWANFETDLAQKIRFCFISPSQL